MAAPFKALFRRIFTTPYHPNPNFREFLPRAQTQNDPRAEVTAAVLDAVESEKLCGVPLARRGVQPVYLRIVNRSSTHLRLQLVGVAANYYTPLEAAALNHFSIAKRLSAFGLIGWLFFLPLLLIVPSKLISASRANRRMDACFLGLGFRLRPIPPGGSAEGFVFTPLDVGTKVFHVRLMDTSEGLDAAVERMEAEQTATPAAKENGVRPALQAAVDLVFAIPVPGVTVDYLKRDLSNRESTEKPVACDRRQLIEKLRGMPATTTNRTAAGHGDPVNLVVIGEFETLLSAFAARWDETETITLASCWKTARSFLIGAQYRYSPVSPLYLFGRCQDLALQRSRRSINERLHLRLWNTPLRINDLPVWVGQISRDIGVRFTLRTWNLTTHRIDPDVDEARDYLVEDLLEAERIDAAGYVDGVPPSDPAAPAHNLTGDSYYTDGKRVVLVLSKSRTAPRFVAWS